MVKAGAKNSKAVAALLDGEKIEMAEDGVKGLDEQLKALKESDAYLFQNDEQQTNKPHILNSENPNGGAGKEDDPFNTVLDRY